MNKQIENKAIRGDASERPLVTFALFAYNQEKYIREAVEGAFAQTYSPLEIILSDDGSKDRTFEIMQEMAADYKGPHKLILNRSQVNLGTALHVSSAASLSKGELITIAAGDDISLPERVEETVKAWLKHGKPIGAIHSSKYDFSDSCKRNLIKSDPAYRTQGKIDLDAWFNKSTLPAAAPTCTFSRDIFDFFPGLIGGSVIEDAPLMFRTCLIGMFIYIDKPLIKQRMLSESAGRGFSANNPDRWNRHVLSKTVSIQTCLRDLQRVNIDPRQKMRAEAIFIKNSALISKFYISNNFQKSAFLKLGFFVRIITTRVITKKNMLYRADFGLRFLDMDHGYIYSSLKHIYKLVIRFRQNKLAESVG